MSYSDEIKKLDRIAKTLSHNSSVKNLTIFTPSGYIVEITEEKYREAVQGGQNPITQILNVTATATAKSSFSVPQEIQKILRLLEDSSVSPRKLSEAKKYLSTLGSELDKPNPDEKVIRRIVRWASKFGLELSLRIGVIVAERLLRPV